MTAAGEENVNPNSSLSRKCPWFKYDGPTAKVANPTRHRRKTIAHTDTIANRSKFPSSMQWKRLSWHNIIACVLVKALIISLLINLHIFSVLSQSDQITEYMKSSSRLMDDQKILACVRNVRNQCQLYPCVDDGRVYLETASPTEPFGYAGRFVHRDADVGKPLMQTIGDKGWGSGCVVSDEYKFVYIHVLKSGGTATKEVRSSIVNYYIISLSFHTNTR